VEKLKGGKIGKGRGLVQWSEGAGSLDAEKKWAADHGLPWDDFQAQLEFARNQNVDTWDEFKKAAPNSAKDPYNSTSGEKAVKDLEHFGTKGARFDTAGTILKNVANGKDPGDGLGGLVSDALKDIPGIIEDINGKFPDQPPGTYAAACPPKGVQMNVSGAIIPKTTAPAGGQ
jgi:hypothetical protein